MSLTIDSTLTLASGGQLPRLGLGVYQARSNECVEAVRTAIEVGYRHMVGRGIASTSTPRSSLFLTTKYMPSHAPQSSSAVYDVLRKSLKPLHRGPFVPNTREGRAEQRRKRQEAAEAEAGLGGDAAGQPTGAEGNAEAEPYIDLFLIHAPWGGPEGRAANWAALAKAQEEGWAKDIGVSNFGVKHLESLPSPKPAVNQIELHPWCQQRPIVEYCQSQGIALQAYCPLVRADPKRFGDPVLQEICKKTGKTEAQVLVRWSLQKGYAPLPKSVTPDRIKSNADVYDFELSEGDMARLDGLDEGAKGACSWNPVDVE